MAVVTGDDGDHAPLPHRRPSGITAAAAEAIPPSPTHRFVSWRSGPGAPAVSSRRRARQALPSSWVRLLLVEWKRRRTGWSSGIVGTGILDRGIEQWELPENVASPSIAHVCCAGRAWPPGPQVGRRGQGQRKKLSSVSAVC
jgi:hypothetical protein